MKILITVPDSCMLLVPATVDSFNFLSTMEVVRERGYPSRIEPSPDGVEFKITPDDIADKNSELNVANQTIADMRKELAEALKEKAPTC